MQFYACPPGQLWITCSHFIGRIQRISVFIHRPDSPSTEYPAAPDSYRIPPNLFFLGLEFHLSAAYLFIYLSINIEEFLLILHKMICVCYLNYTFIRF